MVEISQLTIRKNEAGYVELTQTDWGNGNIVISFPVHQWKLIKWIIEEEIKRPVD